MDWKTFLSEIIADLAWPLLILFIIIKFQKPLLNAAGRINKLQYKDATIEFTNGVVKLEQTIEKSKLKTKSIHPEKHDKFSRILELENLPQRSAIIEAWLILNAEINKLYCNYFDNKNKVPAQVKINKLLNKEIINNDAYELLSLFIRLRNKAEHTMEFEISHETLTSYLNSVYMIVKGLNKNSDKLVVKKNP